MPKKGLPRNLKSFCPRNQVKTKKKVFTAIWDKFGRNLWNLFELLGFFSSVQTALNPRWGNVESRWRDANLDGETRPLALKLLFSHKITKISRRQGTLPPGPLCDTYA